MFAQKLLCNEIGIVSTTTIKMIQLQQYLPLFDSGVIFVAFIPGRISPRSKESVDVKDIDKNLNN